MMCLKKWSCFYAALVMNECRLRMLGWGMGSATLKIHVFIEFSLVSEYVLMPAPLHTFNQTNLLEGEMNFKAKLEEEIAKCDNFYRSKIDELIFLNYPKSDVVLNKEQADQLRTVKQ